MAQKLIINISKKIPGPSDFSSCQASCSIEGEVAAGQDPTVEAARLYAQAEAAVDRQLRIPGATSATPNAHATPARPLPSSASARRPPAPATEAQIRFIRRLLNDGAGNLDTILAEHHISDIGALSCKAAAGLIDRLKAAA